jgi:NAD-dependent DNA ligase
MSPDLAARRILVAAYCYYVLDTSPMSDAEYDKLSNIVADHWDELPPVRQWALGNPTDTRASGSHFKFTTLTVDAARHLVKTEHPYPSKWSFNKEHQVHYVTAVL